MTINDIMPFGEALDELQNLLGRVLKVVVDDRHRIGRNKTQAAHDGVMFPKITG